MSAAPADIKPPFDGGKRALGLAGGAAVVGLGLTAVRAVLDPKVALYAYVTAFAYWLGLALAALILLAIFHAAKAKWPVVLRRLIEVHAGTLVIYPILFIPIVLGMKWLYPWAGDHAGATHEELHLFHHRHVYLNVPFFLGRAVFYFVFWVVLSRLFLLWSTKQDASGAPEYTKRSWTVGPATLPLIGLTVTFAAIDWFQSMETMWFSSMWGVYFFAGSFVAFLGMLIITGVLLNDTPALGGAINTAHFFSLGKFLLAFTCFWAYITFSQYMLTWAANLPDTIPYLIARETRGWAPVSIFLAVGHFVIPFFVLLKRDVRLQPRKLMLVAGWIMVMHFVDVYWVIMPQVRPDQPVVDWGNLTAFVGVGGLAIAALVAGLRGRHLLPVRDPFLSESLGYSKL